MTTITIPKNLISKSNLIAIPYDEYRRLLSLSTSKKKDGNLWQDASRSNLIKSYSKSDSIYDRI